MSFVVEVFVINDVSQAVVETFPHRGPANHLQLPPWRRACARRRGTGTRVRRSCSAGAWCNRQCAGRAGAAPAVAEAQRNGEPACDVHDRRRDRLRSRGRRGARSHCRFVPALVRFTPESLTHPVPLRLKRQCGRTPGHRAHARAREAVRVRSGTPWASAYTSIPFVWRILNAFLRA
jgi:hypothetical protein